VTGVQTCALPIFSLLCLLCLWLSVAGAQEDRRLKPLTPYGGGSDDNSAPAADDGYQEGLTADTRPLSGAQDVTLGSSVRAKDYLVPSLRFVQMADSNALSQTSGSGELQAVSSFSGGLELQRKWRHSQLAVQYAGGGTFYQDAPLNSSFHQFEMAESMTGRRWSLLLSDQLGYSSGASFGFGVAGLGGNLSSSVGSQPGFGLAGLNQAYLPNQSILTSRTSRLSNAALAQVEYHLNSRSSLTASGSYGLLQFLDSGFVSGNQIGFSGGYNHSLNAHDSVAVTYNYSLFRFDDFERRIESHSAELAYGRRLTGRLGLEIAAGPQWTHVEGSPRSFANVFLSGRSTLRYRLHRMELSLNSTHGTSGGSGVLAGAKSHVVQVAVSRDFRRWAGSFHLGYAHNSGLEERGSFHSSFLGAQWSRRAGRLTRLFFNYDLQRQTSGAPRLLRHVFGLGLQWDFRPMRLD